ncbi:adenylyltransferase/cytidyltransferase family protein [Candidatus Woesearchaeota archaeon]|jgi:FAD synthetase|nr:adenylyltransferase/cytidyltransferase family protein [Candidatus Woesearchaeota archaeon]
MTRVLIFGTFDKLHKGHIHFIRKAGEIAEENSKSKEDAELFVVIARDENVEKIKNKTPADQEMKRVMNVYLLGLAKKVILGDKSNFFRAIQEYKPKIICLGYDQDSQGLEEYIKEHKLNIEIKRIDSHEPEIYKSSKL